MVSTYFYKNYASVFIDYEFNNKIKGFEQMLIGTVILIITANDVFVFQIMFTKNVISICYAIALPRRPAISLDFKD